MSKSQRICKALLDYGKSLQKKPNPDGWDISKLDNIEFFYGVIFDQGITAKRAWDAPKELRKRLGHLDPHKIAKMNESTLRKVMRYPKSLHRYWRKMPNWIISASKLLVNRYDGKPENIWNDNPRAGDLQRRFIEFKGISQKKASMATNILVRDKKVQVRGLDLSGIDVSGDVQVRRVFLRAGLINVDSVDSAVRAARVLNPKYPGELDNPTWYIGRNFCRPKKPTCSKCAIGSDCSKKIQLNAKAA
ncbi:endonuclease III [Thermoproteota archaeon]